MTGNNFPEEGEIVLCTVKEIHGTTVFVDLDKYGKTGVIATSEIAPGRIRNIRDYVVPQKKIVCLVLRVDQNKGHIDLSLRRVTKKDTQEELQRHKKEKEASMILNLVLKDKAPKAIEDITKKHPSVYEVLENSKENPKVLEEFMAKDEASKILKIVSEKIKTKKIVEKVEIRITSTSSDGISIIKKALDVNDVKVSYLGAPNYMIISEDKDHKNAKKKLENALSKITDALKKSGAKVEVVEEK